MHREMIEQITQLRHVHYKYGESIKQKQLPHTTIYTEYNKSMINWLMYVTYTCQMYSGGGCVIKGESYGASLAIFSCITCSKIILLNQFCTLTPTMNFLVISGR